MQALAKLDSVVTKTMVSRFDDPHPFGFACPAEHGSGPKAGIHRESNEFQPAEVGSPCQ